MELERIIEELERKIRKKNIQIDESEKEDRTTKDEVLERIEKIERKVYELEGSLDRLIPMLHVIKDSIDIAENNVRKTSEMKSEIVELRREVEMNKNGLEKLEARMNKLVGLEEMVERISSTLKRIEFKVEGSFAEDLIRMREEISANKVELENLKEIGRKVEEIERRMEILHPVFEKVRNQIEDIDATSSKVENLKSLVAKMKNDVELLKIKVGDVESLKTRVEEVSKEIETIFKILKKFETKLEEGFVEKIYELEDKIGALNLEIEKVKTQINRIEKPVSSLIEVSRRVDLIEEEVEDILRSIKSRVKTKRRVRKKSKKK